MIINLNGLSERQLGCERSNNSGGMEGCKKLERVQTYTAVCKKILERK